MKPSKTVPGLILAMALGVAACAEATSVPLSARPATSSAAPTTLGGTNVPNPVTDATFAAEVNASPLPVVLFVWAEWAGPCRILLPSIVKLAQDPAFTGRMIVRCLNVDDNPTTAMALGIRSIPTVLILRGGKVVDTLFGAVPNTQLLAFVNRNLP